jgi:hypothetical protein
MAITGYNFGQFGSNNPQGTVQFFTSVNGGQAKAVTPPMLVAATQSPLVVGVSIRATLPAGTNVVTASYSGDQDFNPVTAGPVTIVVTDPDFTVNSEFPALTVSAGGSTTGSLAVTPILGFSGAVSLSCGSGLPAGSTCSFSPSSLSSGGGASNLTVTLQGPFTAQAANRQAGWMTGGKVFSIAGLLLLGFAARRKKALASLLTLVLAFVVLSGCGGSSSPSSTLVVVGSSQAKVASGTAVTLTAQVSGGDKAATGTIAFFDGTTSLRSPVALVDGGANLQVNNLTVGTHAITAKYNGDSHHLASSSEAYYEAITGATNLQIVAASGSLSHTINVKLTVD